MRFLPSRLALLIAGFFLLLAVPRFAAFYTDWLWFAEVGYQQVLVRSLTTQGMTAAVAALVAFAILFVNLRVALRALRPRQFMVATAQGPQVITVDPRRVRPLVSAAAVLVALLIGAYAGTHWETWLFYLHGTSFGTADPVLGRDIGFYVFTLPILELLHGLLFTTLLLTTAGVLAAYVAANSLGLDATRGLFASDTARKHLAILASLLLLVLAFGAWLRIP